MNLCRQLTFLLESPTVSLKVLLFWIYLFFDTSICSTMALHPLGNSDHDIVIIDFPSPGKSTHYSGRMHDFSVTIPRF